MSGPVKNEKLYESYRGEMQWDQNKVDDLRELADNVEDGLLIDDSDIPNEQIADLLRDKAETIDLALQMIQNTTDSDYNQLVKAIQYNYSGDWGADAVKEAWDNYSDN